MNDKYAVEYDKMVAADAKNKARNAILDTQYKELMRRK